MMGHHPLVTLTIYPYQYGGGTVNNVKYSKEECNRKIYELTLEQNIKDLMAWEDLAAVSLHSASLFTS